MNDSSASNVINEVYLTHIGMQVGSAGARAGSVGESGDERPRQDAAKWRRSTLVLDRVNK